MVNEDSLLSDSKYDRKAYFRGTRDPQEYERSLKLDDVFRRVEIEQDASLFGSSEDLGCAPDGNEVAEQAGYTPAEWIYVRTRYPSLLENYRISGMVYFWTLPKLLKICRDRVLADYKPVKETKAKQKMETK